jgi:cell division initiation protein
VRLSPMDVRQQQFRKGFRGLDADEVRAFLDDVAGDLENLLRENALLKDQMHDLEDRLRGVEDRERLLQETLISTQRLTEEMKQNAKKDAGLVLREAELEGEKLVESARGEEAEIRSEIAGLRRARRQLFEGLRSTIEMYQRLIEQDMRLEPPDPR